MRLAMFTEQLIDRLVNDIAIWLNLVFWLMLMVFIHHSQQRQQPPCRKMPVICSSAPQCSFCHQCSRQRDPSCVLGILQDAITDDAKEYCSPPRQLVLEIQATPQQAKISEAVSKAKRAEEY